VNRRRSRRIEGDRRHESRAESRIEPRPPLASRRAAKNPAFVGPDVERSGGTRLDGERADEVSREAVGERLPGLSAIPAADDTTGGGGVDSRRVGRIHRDRCDESALVNSSPLLLFLRAGPDFEPEKKEKERRAARERREVTAPPHELTG